MGNDGGSMSHRAEMVKQKKRELKKEKYAAAKAKASHCALSKETLREPIAVCRMGLLYNKEQIIKRLIEKTMPDGFRHIKKLKDIKEPKVEFKENADGTKSIFCPLS